MWWERVAKKQIRLLFTREGTGKRKENAMEIFLPCDLLQNLPHQAEKMTAVKRLKTKRVKLYCARLAREVELQTPERIQEERIALYRLIKRRTRREQITEIQGPKNGTQTSMKEMDAFSACIRQKYGPILVEEE
jgi:hypothetical protein